MALHYKLPPFTTIRTSIWLFPAILLFFLLALTALKIHGSSVGIYHNILTGSAEKDSDLLFGQPRAIRSDEWKVWTPTTILQTRTDFPAFNEKLGSGRSVITRPDAPAKDWATLLRPHNWAFFVLPLEFAFAFRWWLVLYLLLVSFYFVVLKIMSKKQGRDNIPLAVLLSLSFGLSPFLLWWYQSSAFLIPAYALFLLLIFIHLLKRTKKHSLVSLALYSLLIGYLMSCVGLLIYIPFMVPVGITAGAVCIALLLEQRKKTKETIQSIIKKLLPFIIGALIAGGIGLAFIADNRPVIESISGSVYPGKRIVGDGQLSRSSMLPIFGGFLTPLLQNEKSSKSYYTNQSEASTFVLILPLLLIPGLLLAFKRNSKNQWDIDYPLLSTMVVGLLFMLRISLPMGSSFYGLLLLDRVPHNRLLMGLGFVGFLFLMFFIRAIRSSDPGSVVRRFAFPWALLCYTPSAAVSLYVTSEYPGFADSTVIALILGVIPPFIIYLYLKSKTTLATAVLLVFTLFASHRILPLYRGLSSITESTVVKEMRHHSTPRDSWLVVDTMNFQGLPLIAGRGTIGGTQIYSDPSFWREIDQSKDKEYVYNRQAHAIFISNQAPHNPDAKHNVTRINDSLELVKSNVFKIKFSCSPFTYKYVDYVLTTTYIQKPCLNHFKTVAYPKTNFYLYKVVRDN